MSQFMNPLPPQAYTKDTLVQAYAWLQGQSDSVKEIATNPDILVSLFLKSKIQGDQFFERPSIQNFKNELRNLAGMMGEFEQTPAPPTEAKLEPKFEPKMEAKFALKSDSVISHTPHSLPHNPMPSLDESSLQMIQEVKTSLNMTSETEVMRLLIAIGYHKCKVLYKDS